MTRVQLLELRDALFNERQNWNDIYERVTTEIAKDEAKRRTAHCDEKLRLVRGEIDRRT